MGRRILRDSQVAEDSVHACSGSRSPMARYGGSLRPAAATPGDQQCLPGPRAGAASQTPRRRTVLHVDVGQFPADGHLGASHRRPGIPLTADFEMTLCPGSDSDSVASSAVSVKKATRWAGDAPVDA